MRKVVAIILSAILAVFVCYETDTYLHPRPARAASQFANSICDNYTPVSVISANTRIVLAGNSNMFVYICGYNLNSSAAITFSIVEGTGATCGTGTAGMVGGATAAGGLSLAI